MTPRVFALFRTCWRPLWRLRSPDFLKIDVEGAEDLVLAGGQSCLLRHRPFMIIETANDGLIRRIADMDYFVARLDGGNLLFVPNRPGRDLAPFRSLSPEEVFHKI